MGFVVGSEGVICRCLKSISGISKWLNFICTKITEKLRNSGNQYTSLEALTWKLVAYFCAFMPGYLSFILPSLPVSIFGFISWAFVLDPWVSKVDFALLSFLLIYLFKKSTPSAPAQILAQIQQHFRGQQKQQVLLRMWDTEAYEAFRIPHWVVQ